MPSKKPKKAKVQPYRIIAKKKIDRLIKRLIPHEQEDFSNDFKNLFKENVIRAMPSKKPKVKQDISKIDFTNAPLNLFNESPVVEHNRTFQNVTSVFLIKKHSRK